MKTLGFCAHREWLYNYDVNDRLTSESLTGGSNPTNTTYSYLNTQQSGKTATSSGITTTQSFVYDLQGLLASVTIAKSDATTLNKTVYRYDSTGTRTGSAQYVASSSAPTSFSIQSDTQYLTDSQNHTGYSQVLQETNYNDSGQATKKVIYTIGHDQISQTVLLTLPNGGEGWIGLG